MEMLRSVFALCQHAQSPIVLGMEKARPRVLWLWVCVVVLFTVGVRSQAGPAGRINPVQRWLGGNTRFALDMSYRGTLPSTTGKATTVGAVGFDLHHVFSGETRDFGTLVAQGYLLRHDGAKMRPGFIEHEDDWDWTWRILSFNLTALSQGEFNIEAGHLELPFGLEQIFDTNGTIRDFRLGQNLGVKADWGAGINGVLRDVDYRVTVTRGSGVEYHRTGDPYAICGRVATPSSNRFSVGLSGFGGKVGMPGAQVDRTRAAVDAKYDVNAFTYLGELSSGEDDGDDRTQLLLEIDWSNFDETLLIYLQDISLWNEIGATTDTYNRLGVGFRYRPDINWDFSAEVRQDIEQFDGAERVFAVVAQVRYRF